MNKDHIVGAVKETRGAIKELFGRVSRDTRLIAEGATERAAGRLLYALANARDVIRSYH